MGLLKACPRRPGEPTGGPIAISGYPGSGDVFDHGATESAFRYADPNQRDFEAFTDAIASGPIEANDDEVSTGDTGRRVRGSQM
jgi:hypothetical protein